MRWLWAVGLGLVVYFVVSVSLAWLVGVPTLPGVVGLVAGIALTGRVLPARDWKDWLVASALLTTTVLAIAGVIYGFAALTRIAPAVTVSERETVPSVASQVLEEIEGDPRFARGEEPEWGRSVVQRDADGYYALIRWFPPSDVDDWEGWAQQICELVRSTRGDWVEIEVRGSNVRDPYRQGAWWAVSTGGQPCEVVRRSTY